MTATVDYSLVVNRFVSMYTKDEMAALAWANDNIDARMHTQLKPLIRQALKDLGYKFTDEVTS